MHHRLARLARLAIPLAAVAACTDAPSEPGPATEGIYQLHDRAVVDSCTPPRRSEGYLLVQLTRTDQSLGLVIPRYTDDGNFWKQRLDLPVPALATQTEVGFPGCAAGRDHLALQVVSEHPDAVEASLDRTWTDLTGCTPDFDTPPTDCTTTRALTYTLLEPCPAACAVIDTAGPPTCRC